MAETKTTVAEKENGSLEIPGSDFDKIDHFVIDPPWPQKKIVRKCRPNQKKNLDYITISIPEIFDLLDREVFPLAKEQHTVWLWVIDKFLTEAEDEMRLRNYRLHTRFIWDKQNGVAPAFTVRYCHEYLLWFYKPKFTRPQHARGKFGTVIDVKSREHSRKPDEAYSMIEALYPNMRYMDVFSREKRANWEQWGNQKDHFNASETTIVTSN